MKFYLAYILILCSIVSSYAQVGINNPNPDTTSILDLTSNKLGLLIPRMTSFERKTIVDPANGLMVYDTDDAMLYYFDGTYNNGDLPNAWTGLSALRFRDDETFPEIIIGGASGGGDTTVYTRDLYTHETVRNIGVATETPLNKLSVNGNMSIGDSTTIAPENGLAVKGNIEADTVSGNVISGFGTVPLGGIIMWSGDVVDIPDGWRLCDGTFSTPNLSGKFVVGVGDNGTNSYTEGDEGGDDEVTLKQDESALPEHTHHVQHTHSITDPEHSHGVRNDSDQNEIFEESGQNALSHTGRADPDTRNYFTSQGSTTGITIDNYTGDTQGVVTPVTTAPEAHENRPTYFALAYIMRVN